MTNNPHIRVSNGINRKCSRPLLHSSQIVWSRLRETNGRLRNVRIAGRELLILHVVINGVPWHSEESNFNILRGHSLFFWSSKTRNQRYRDNEVWDVCKSFLVGVCIFPHKCLAFHNRSGNSNKRMINVFRPWRDTYEVALADIWLWGPGAHTNEASVNWLVLISAECTFSWDILLLGLHMSPFLIVPMICFLSSCPPAGRGWAGEEGLGADFQFFRLS